jgi:hypothetical protein
MREALFIKRNAEKWQQYQQEPDVDADEQAERFITLLDDLAYSRTFYPQSKVTRWINNIAAGIYQKIYRNRKEKYSRLTTFWTTELTLVLYRHRLDLPHHQPQPNEHCPAGAGEGGQCGVPSR